MTKFKNWTTTLSDVLQMTKKEYVLTITLAALGGIVFGMLFSPKKTTVIGSYNSVKELSEEEENSCCQGNGQGHGHRHKKGDKE